MLRVILKTFLLISLVVAAGLSPGINLSHAQPSRPALIGEWVGNIDSPPSSSLVKGKSELTRLSLTENAGEIRFPHARFTRKLSIVQLDGSRVRFELSDLKLVMTGTIASDEIDGEAEVPGTKAHFHLIRTGKVTPEILASYVGAYRFRNGDYFVIDRFADTPDTLFVTDVKSGEARAMFPRSETQFTGGPFLYVASPTRRTITFRGAGADLVDLDLKGRQSGSFATRIPMSQEEVTFKNGDVTLAGTLLIPASKGKHPAIVFTHGGGPALREVYWGLGYLYAPHGFVVLSYDKRGVGKSTGKWREASFEDLADDAVAAAKFLQARMDINPKQIGFWGQSQGGWIAPLAASHFPDAAFAIALSGGGLSPAEQELFDSEYELSKAGYAANEVKDALTFQKLKNDIIESPASPASDAKWDEYAKMRLTAKDAKWFRHQGIDVFGPEKRDDPFWSFMRRFYAYDPAPTLRASKAPLLAIFGELDTPEGVKANVRAIKQILDQSGRSDYTVKVYPNGRHNLMEVPPDNPTEYVRLKRFPPGLFEMMVDWTTLQLRQPETSAPQATKVRVALRERDIYGDLFVTTAGTEKKVTDQAQQAWIINGGLQVVYSSKEGAGGYEDEGQSLHLYDVATGKHRRIMSEYFIVETVKEVITRNKKRALLVTMEDSGLGASYLAVIDPLRGEVFFRRWVRLLENKDDTIVLGFFREGDWAELESGKKVLPYKRERHDLNTLLRGRVMVNKKESP